MMYWFAVAPDRPEILDVGIRNGLWGVVEDALDEIDVLEPGDFILFFHRDDGFVLCEVESEPYTERVPVWPEVDFPHRVRISDPVETDRYAHLGEVHDCLLDPETDEPYSSTAKAASALEAAAGTFRELTEEEIRCLFGRLGWTPPPGVAVAPAPGDGEEVEPDPAEEDDPDFEDQTPAVAAPVGEGPEPEDAGPAATEEPADEAGAAAADTDAVQEEVEAEPAEEEEEETEEPAETEAPSEEAEPDGEEEPAGPRVILAPAAGNEASRRRWKETVEAGVPIDRVQDHLSDEEVERLREASDVGRVRVWGTAPARDEGSRAQWTDSGPGDVILFSGGGEIFASARVLAKRRDPGLAEELWGRRDDGSTWEFLFFATKPATQAVTYEAFNDVADYESGYRIPRLNILETERSRRILSAFPEFSAVPREGADAEIEPVEAPAEEEPAEPTEEAGADEAARAGEEEAPPPERAAAMDEVRLRTLLFGRRELGRCALCGQLLPVELLSVVYVKPLEACAPDELEDVGNNVLPGCRLGCAGLFRQGYVVVEEGVIEPGREEPLTEPVEARIEDLVGNRCEYWHSGSEPYFLWHAGEHREG